MEALAVIETSEDIARAGSTGNEKLRRFMAGADGSSAGRLQDLHNRIPPASVYWLPVGIVSGCYGPGISR
jgi:hypothetical protein